MNLQQPMTMQQTLQHWGQERLLLWRWQHKDLWQEEEGLWRKQKGQGHDFDEKEHPEEVVLAGGGISTTNFVLIGIVDLLSALGG